MDSLEEDGQRLPGIIKRAAETPVRILTAPSTQRFLIQTILLIAAGFLFTGLSVFAYLAFYYQYIPAVGMTLPVYLQFHPSAHHPSLPAHANYHHPFALVPLPKGSLVSGQKYDVTVHACFPRTPENVDAGNFMIDVELRGPSGSRFPPLNSSDTRDAPLLAREARPAILAYANPVVSMARTLFAAPLQVLGLADDKTCLNVPVMEGVSFSKGWRNQPEAARVEIRSAVGLRIYSVSVEFSAEFEGLRWLMYNHRILAFAIFTTSFWSVAMCSALVAWLAASSYFGGSTAASGRAAIKNEAEADATDSSVVKREPDDEATTSTAQEQAGAEADDEDEEDDFVLDEPGMQPVSGAGLAGAASPLQARAWADDSGLGSSVDRSASSSSNRTRRREFEYKQED